MNHHHHYNFCNSFCNNFCNGLFTLVIGSGKDNTDQLWSVCQSVSTCQCQSVSRPVTLGQASYFGATNKASMTQHFDDAGRFVDSISRIFLHVPKKASFAFRDMRMGRATKEKGKEKTAINPRKGTQGATGNKRKEKLTEGDEKKEKDTVTPRNMSRENLEMSGDRDRRKIRQTLVLARWGFFIFWLHVRCRNLCAAALLTLLGEEKTESGVKMVQDGVSMFASPCMRDPPFTQVTRPASRGIGGVPLYGGWRKAIAWGAA